MNEALIFIDGASSGNPGPSAIGVVIKDRRQAIIKEVSYSIGEATNNIAEYLSLIIALLEAKQMGIKVARIFTDSRLLYGQLTGKFRVRNFNLHSLHKLVKYQEKFFDKIIYNNIKRNKNKEANRLARKALKKK